MASMAETAAETRTFARGTGILPFQQLRHMVREGEIGAGVEILADQIQPASIDLRLGAVAWRVRASFLPGPEATVREKIEQLDGYRIDLTNGAVLERGCVYVVELLETLALRSTVAGFANPKSSTGRLDVLTRLITDRAATFDEVAQKYAGPLYVELAPRTFSVVVRTGSRLNQLRFRRGAPVIAGGELSRLYEQGALVGTPDPQGARRERQVGVSIDLHGTGAGSRVGWRARKHTDRIDVDQVGAYDPLDFWEPILHRPGDAIILDPNDFYILATREAVRVPPEFAAEMVAYDTSVGEFRVHYAGFFDPGFGWGDAGVESRAVLEVRSHEVPFMLEHGQTIGWLRYEHMLARPDRLYGVGLKSNYQGQGLALAKQFRRIG
jgi:dCTP deaminase